MSDEFAQQNATFLSWLASCGAIVSPSVRVADYRSEGRGRGVAATRDIVEDEEIFRIPRGAILLPGTSSVSNELVNELITEGGQEDPWLGLIVAICHEHSMGAESIWKPYLDILPTKFDTPIFWSTGELSELQASSLKSKVGKEGADEEFKVRLTPLIKRLPSASQLGGDADILRLCHRVASTIMAYAFDIEPPPSSQIADEEGYVSDAELEALPKGMVPFADLLNANGTRNNARLFYEADALVMKSIGPINEGEEIFNDYGELPRSDLLRRYGYVTDEYTMWDVVELSFHELILPAVQRQTLAEEGEMEERLAYLEGHDALDSSYDISRARDDGLAHGYARLLPQLPAELLVVLQTLLLPAEEFERYKQRNRLPKFPKADSDDQPIPATMMKVLYEVVEARISEYPTTLFMDITLRGDPAFTHSTRKAMALEIRIGEKEVLADAKASLLRVMQRPNDERSTDDADTEGAEGTRISDDRKSKRQRLR